MINWQGKPKDRHLCGETPIGTAWIRLDREGKVTGLYLVQEQETHKWVPHLEWQENLEYCKAWMEELLRSVPGS